MSDPPERLVTFRGISVPEQALETIFCVSDLQKTSGGVII